MSFKDLISRHRSDLTLVQSMSGNWTTERILLNIDQTRPMVIGARLAIHLTDPGEALSVLATLDGAAETILLIASSAPPEQIPRMLELAGIQAVITDQAEELRALGIPNTVRRVEELAQRFNAVNPRASRWVLATSGTSSTPKLVVHTFETLTRTTKTSSKQGAKIRWGMMYEWPRFAGLQVFLQSTLSGSTLLAPPIKASLKEQIDFLIHAKCTHLSATPTMWRKISMTAGANRLLLQQISLGGEIVGEKILCALSLMFPEARITHIYASTEAGVGFSVSDRLPGFPEEFLSEPPTGIALRISNGRLHIRNTAMQPTYLGTEICFGADDGWIDTGDNIRQENGRCYFLGRASGVINVGGNKAHPEEIENILLQYPGVIATRVYGKSNPVTGYLVAAEVAMQPIPEDIKSLQKALRQHAANYLDTYKVPALITFTTSITTSTAGKISRIKE